MPDLRLPAVTVRAVTPSVSVVVPAMNEERNIRWVLERIPSCVSEVIVVDGYSSDRTVEVARATRPDVITVPQRGRGKGAALRTGFERATGDFIVAIDADGSMEPAEIEYYVAALHQGYDLVKGSRQLRAGGSLDLTLVRRLGNGALVGAVNLMWGSSFSDLCYGYFGLRRDKLELLGLTSGGFEIETEIAVRAVEAGLRIAEVPSVELLRQHGLSHLNAWTDGWRILRLLARERLPLARRPLVDALDRRGLHPVGTP
ncbi:MULTISPECIES: glycosyltransferase family 2 protein [Kribbella]|uniref:glycosyltransferase family 2 protein n=1 Tax=Kribbella TaxID=182639 RepID=UPI0013050E9E|nr:MULTISPECIES: glycosyltransferase family 2 protein [Kribbella]